MPDLVSVIIPSYNRAFCVGHAINSALAQTHANVEAMVIDDGSKDNTREFIQQTYGHEPRVKYLYQENQGVAAARNTGLRQAQGDFVAFLDSDDLWRPWKLEMQLACLRAFPQAGMIWSEMEAIDPDGKFVQARFLRTMYGAYQWFTSEQLFPDKRALRDIMPSVPSEHQDRFAYAGDIFSPMVMGNLVHTSTTLLTRERFEKVRGFDVALTPVGEDYDFHLRTCREGPVAFVDVPTIQYQLGYDDRLTKLTHQFATSFLKTLQRTLASDKERIKLPGWMLEQVQADTHAWVAEELMTRGDKSTAARHFRESLRHQRWQPRVYMQWLRCKMPGFLERVLVGAYRAIKPAKPPADKR